MKVPVSPLVVTIVTEPLAKGSVSLTTATAASTAEPVCPSRHTSTRLKVWMSPPVTESAFQCRKLFSCFLLIFAHFL